MTAEKQSSGRMVMKGVLSVLSLPGLIQTIDTKKNIHIILKPESKKVGKLYFSHGKIIHASLGDKIVGKKAFFRMMNWKDIPFEIFELIQDTELRDKNISIDTKELIFEGTRQVDEINKLESKLPQYYKIKKVEDFSIELNTAENEIISLASSGEFVKDLLDKNPRDDLEIFKIIMELVKKKVITFLQIKVLIIDDNRFFAGLINDVMEKLFKQLFTTIVVDNGEKGIAVIEGQSKPDLVISDLIMEGKDGFDVIDAAKKNSLPIIILTSERRNRELIIERGATYMHKSVLGTDEFEEFFKKAIFDTLLRD